MGSAFGNLLAFVVAISVLVAVHEYGHYIVGRWTGMKVLRFSIGFGKPIWTRIGRGEDRTEYCISAIPLGGYVRFLDTREGPIPEADEGRAFNQRPVPQRIAVLLAGPAFNFLFAIIAYWALFLYGIPTLVPAVGEVEPGSYAAEAGLEQGDRIVAVGDVETADWESALVEMLDQMVSDGRVPLTLEADDGWQGDATIYVGADARRLERMAAGGEIPCQKVGGQLRFNRAEITEWLQQNMATMHRDHLAELGGRLGQAAQALGEDAVVVGDQYDRLAHALTKRSPGVGTRGRLDERKNGRDGRI